jgi:aldehyde:ferredoxin oxidoreductase
MSGFRQEDFRVLGEFSFEPRAVERGYAMRTLHVDVGSRTAAAKPVTDDMKKRFTGGKGFGLKLLWDATKPSTKWNDPENEM